MAHEIEKRFNLLRENYTGVNVVKFIDFLRSQPVEDVLENAKWIYSEPTMGASFLLETIQSIPEGPVEVFESLYTNELVPYINKAVDANYENTEHLNILKECSQALKERFEGISLMENTILNIQNNSDDELEVLQEGLFGGNPEKKEAKKKVKFFKDSQKELLASAKKDIRHLPYYQKAMMNFIDMNKNDLATITQIRFFVSGQKGDCIADTGAFQSDENIRRFANHQLKFIDSQALPTIMDHYNRLMEEKHKVTKEGFEAVDENIGTMAPDIIYAEENADIPVMKKKLQTAFSVNFVRTFMDESDEINLESFNAMLRAGFAYDNLAEEEILTEGAVTKAAKKVAIAGDTAARKAANGMRRSGREAKRVKVIAKKIPGHFDKLADNTIGQIGKMDKAERRKRIIEGGFKFKLLKIIRNGILLGAAWAVSPALAAIGILVNLILDRQLDRKVRGELLDDLELELKMTREKIKDAESKGDTKKKYQLMRIENALERDIERVRYRLNTIKVSKKGVSV